MGVWKIILESSQKSGALALVCRILTLLILIYVLRFLWGDFGLFSLETVFLKGILAGPKLEKIDLSGDSMIVYLKE